MYYNIQVPHLCFVGSLLATPPSVAPHGLMFSYVSLRFSPVISNCEACLEVKGQIGVLA